jgi:hypothetical protein
MDRLSEARTALAAKTAPWPQLCGAWSAPADWLEARARARANFLAFGANYALLVAALVAANALLHPAAALIAAGAFCGARATERARGSQLSQQELAWACVATAAVVLVFTSAALLVAESLLAGLALAMAHSVLHVPEEYFDGPQ